MICDFVFFFYQLFINIIINLFLLIYVLYFIFIVVIVDVENRVVRSSDLTITDLFLMCWDNCCASAGFFFSITW